MSGILRAGLIGTLVWLDSLYKPTLSINSLTFEGITLPKEGAYLTMQQQTYSSMMCAVIYFGWVLYCIVFYMSLISGDAKNPETFFQIKLTSSDSGLSSSRFNLWHHWNLLMPFANISLVLLVDGLYLRLGLAPIFDSEEGHYVFCNKWVLEGQSVPSGILEL